MNDIDKAVWHDAFQELYSLVSLNRDEFLEEFEEWKRRHVSIVNELDSRKKPRKIEFSKSELRRYIRDYKF